MQEDKVAFIRDQLCVLLRGLDPVAKPLWGKMNVQQMTEHLTDFFKVSTGENKFELVIPEEDLPKYKAFLLSDKQFRENTKAPSSVLGEEPLPVRTASMAAALTQLEASINDFFQCLKNDRERKTVHPVFGPLNYEEWIQLHYKHVTHHCRQFGIV